MPDLTGDEKRDLVRAAHTNTGGFAESHSRGYFICSADMGHDAVTLTGERDAMIGRWRKSAIAAAAMLACAGQVSAQTAAPKAAAPAKSVAPAKGAATAAKPPSIGGAEPTLIGQFGSWGAYSASPGGKTVCFALARPSSSKTNPPNRPRDPAYAFVSTRPAEKVANEVSVMIGYQLKPGSESSLEVGSARYAMYIQGDGLWLKNAAEEERLVDALRKGTDVTVKGVSARGTETTDVFALKGLAQALDKVAQSCR